MIDLYTYSAFRAAAVPQHTVHASNGASNQDCDGAEGYFEGCLALGLAAEKSGREKAPVEKERGEARPLLLSCSCNQPVYMSLPCADPSGPSGC